MGTDIHLRVQKRVSGVWEFVEAMVPCEYEEGQMRPEEWYDGRNYDLFGMLANVRNGTGFAGVDTGDGFVPIAEPRGLPEDILQEQALRFGDHSFSWLGLDELLAYDWYQQTKSRGWVNGVEFEAWDRMKRWSPAPKSYCGGVSGEDVVHVTEDQMRQAIAQVSDSLKDWKKVSEEIARLYGSTYCQVEWPVFYAEAAGKFYTQTMPRMVRLAKTVSGPENVRIVFGFDS